MRRSLLAVALSLAAAPVPAAAQDDPLLQSTPADTAASAFAWTGDAALRYEHTNGLPGARPSSTLERVRSRVRAGFLWSPRADLEIGAALKAGLGSDANRDNIINNDNERSDGVGLDQAFVRWRPRESTSVLVGKAAFPFELSPLVWDRDLRPAGISLDQGIALGDFNRLQIVVGAFAGSHLYGDDSRIGAAQVAWRWHEGAPTNAAVLVSYLAFDELDTLARNGLGRTNLRTPAGFVSDFRLLDLQLVGRHTFGRWPVELRLDMVRNLGADADADGGRLSLVAGDRRVAHAWELGFAWQRQQRDAVLAAFSEDDWWFHSFAHGAMPWIGYGITDALSVRLAGFREQRDGLPGHTRRLLLDLEARW